MVKLLALECEPGSLSDLCGRLADNGFSVEAVLAASASSAQLRCISCTLILCELAAARRREIQTFLSNQNAPILWIAQPQELPRVIRSFRMGMEDYILHSTGTAELLARIRMLMLCAGIDTGRRLQVGSVFLDADARICIADGAEIPLTMREFNLIFALLSAPDKVFTREELMRAYWGAESKTGPRAVDVYMARLREKFAACRAFQIVTVHGVGYKVSLPQQGAEPDPEAACPGV